MSTAIVTGGAGFIGSHLVERLLADGWSVIACDDLSSGHEENVPPEADLIVMDVADPKSVDALPKSDVVFHLASHVGSHLSFDRPFHDLRVNALSAVALLDWCRRKDINRIVCASSVAVYGNQDDPDAPVREDAPLRPLSPYGVGKLTAEQLCAVYEPLGLATTNLRLFNTYGPRQDMDNRMQGMLSIYMSYVAEGKPVYVRGSLERFRDFTYVTDVADAFVRCLHERARGKVFNVASGRKTTVRELIDAIVSGFGGDPRQYPIEEGPPTTQDQFGFFGDSSSIRSAVGWSPTVTLDEGIERMAAWVRTGWTPA